MLRNVTIQRTAEGLKEIDRLYKARRYQDAYNLAAQLEQDLRQVAALTGETQMTKDADLMRQYQATLSKWVESQSTNNSDEGATPEPTRFYRGRVTATVPVLDVR